MSRTTTEPVWIGWRDDDVDETVHLGGPKILEQMCRRRWQFWVPRKWAAWCGESLESMTVGRVEDSTCMDCEVERIKARGAAAS